MILWECTGDKFTPDNKLMSKPLNKKNVAKIFMMIRLTIMMVKMTPVMICNGHKDNYDEKSCRQRKNRPSSKIISFIEVLVTP